MAPRMDTKKDTCPKEIGIRANHSRLNNYSLCFKIKVTFGEKLRQTNWNVAKIDANVVVDDLPSQIIVYTCSTYLDSTASTHINTVLYALMPSAQNGGLLVKLAPKVFDFTMDTPSSPESA